MTLEAQYMTVQNDIELKKGGDETLCLETCRGYFGVTAAQRRLQSTASAGVYA
jgi:hypothetical protein